MVEDPQSGRYHLYAGWFCPWSQRTTIARTLAGLQGIVTVSYVDNARDGRGWAFRQRYGVTACHQAASGSQAIVAVARRADRVMPGGMMSCRKP